MLPEPGLLCSLTSVAAARPHEPGCYADFNKQTQHFLNFTVPRMHQETKPGEATPCQAQSTVGAQVDFDKIGTSANDGEEKIYKYVQEPLRKWLANFDTVVVRATRRIMPLTAACLLSCMGRQPQQSQLTADSPIPMRCIKRQALAGGDPNGRAAAAHARLAASDSVSARGRHH